MDEVLSVEVEQVTYFEIDQLVNHKRVLKETDRNIAKSLKFFKNPLVLKLNNAHPKLFPVRLKYKQFKYSTIKQVQKKVHMEADRNKATRIKPLPTAEPPIYSQITPNSMNFLVSLNISYLQEVAIPVIVRRNSLSWIPLDSIIRYAC